VDEQVVCRYSGFGERLFGNARSGLDHVGSILFFDKREAGEYLARDDVARPFVHLAHCFCECWGGVRKQWCDRFGGLSPEYLSAEVTARLFPQACDQRGGVVF